MKNTQSLTAESHDTMFTVTHNFSSQYIKMQHNTHSSILVQYWYVSLYGSHNVARAAATLKYIHVSGALLFFDSAENTVCLMEELISCRPHVFIVAPLAGLEYILQRFQQFSALLNCLISFNLIFIYESSVENLFKKATSQIRSCCIKKRDDEIHFLNKKS